MTTMSKKAPEQMLTGKESKKWTAGQIILMILIAIFSLSCLLPFLTAEQVPTENQDGNRFLSKGIVYRVSYREHLKKAFTGE